MIRTRHLHDGGSCGSYLALGADDSGLWSHPGLLSLSDRTGCVRHSPVNALLLLSALSLGCCGTCGRQRGITHSRGHGSGHGGYWSRLTQQAMRCRELESKARGSIRPLYHERSRACLDFNTNRGPSQADASSPRRTIWTDLKKTEACDPAPQLYQGLARTECTARAPRSRCAR